MRLHGVARGHFLRSAECHNFSHDHHSNDDSDNITAVRATHDGSAGLLRWDCTIRVSKGTEFPLDAEAFGLIGFVATVVSRDAFECQLYDRSGGAFTLSLKKPGDSAAGQLNVPTWVTLVSIDTTTAVIAIGHTEPP